jgi:acetyltransferase
MGGGRIVTYTIAKYPAHMIDVVRIYGSRITIRPTLPQDVDLQRAFFRSLSAESRYCRFMSRLRELPDCLVERFTSIDYRGHVALLAEVFNEAGHETMIGEARYVVEKHDPTTCEFALAVADDWRASGIGRSLLERLEQQAAASGIHRMVADTLITNKAMQRLAARTGYAISARRGDVGLARLEKALVQKSSVQPRAA